MIQKKNIPYYAVAMLVFVILKYYFSQAITSDLLFLLKPVNTLVEILTGSHGEYFGESGFYHQQYQIFIEKSCAGFNFLLICFLMLSILFIRHSVTPLRKTLSLAAALIASYFITIMVNGSRIYVSIILQSQPFIPIAGHQKTVHEIIGIITNLLFLITIYIITDKLLQNKVAHEKTQ